MKIEMKRAKKERKREVERKSRNVRKRAHESGVEASWSSEVKRGKYRD